MSEEAKSNESAVDDSEHLPLPPPTVEFLILSFKTQAEMHMGLLRVGDESEQPKPNARLARHTIDMLAMLQQKTRGNLTYEEQRLLDNSLTELRFRYVQQFGSSSNP